MQNGLPVTTLPPPHQRSFGLRLNIWLLRSARNWLRIAAVVVGLYASLPFITPMLMEAGLTGVGRVLYTIYSPFCHQFAFRSLFLFGEQPAYPRAVTGTSVTPFEAYAIEDPAFLESYAYWYGIYNDGQQPGTVTLNDLTDQFTPWFQFASRDFVGNAQMGYKMTLCARDVAIYGAIFAGVLLYSIPALRRRLRPVPIWLYLLLGIGPIGIDGFSQLLGYPPFNLWSPRETLPVFRVVTGVLFGIMNAWLALPYLEQSMRETREAIEFKLAQKGILIR